MGKRRTTIMSALGIAAFVVVALLSAGYWMLTSMTQVETVDAARADAVLGDARAAFTAVEPAFNARDGRVVMVRQPPATPGSDARSLFVLAWRPSAGTLARTRVPLSMLSFTTEPIPLDRFAEMWGSPLDVDGLELRVRDIQRYGPTLLLDDVDDGGNALLIWTE